MAITNDELISHIQSLCFMGAVSIQDDCGSFRVSVTRGKKCTLDPGRGRLMTPAKTIESEGGNLCKAIMGAYGRIAELDTP